MATSADVLPLSSQESCDSVPLVFGECSSDDSARPVKTLQGILNLYSQFYTMRHGNTMFRNQIHGNVIINSSNTTMRFPRTRISSLSPPPSSKGKKKKQKKPRVDREALDDVDAPVPNQIVMKSYVHTEEDRVIKRLMTPSATNPTPSAILCIRPAMDTTYMFKILNTMLYEPIMAKKDSLVDVTGSWLAAAMDTDFSIEDLPHYIIQDDAGEMPVKIEPLMCPNSPSSSSDGGSHHSSPLMCTDEAFLVPHLPSSMTGAETEETTERLLSFKEKAALMLHVALTWGISLCAKKYPRAQPGDLYVSFHGKNHKMARCMEIDVDFFGPVARSIIYDMISFSGSGGGGSLFETVNADPVQNFLTAESFTYDKVLDSIFSASEYRRSIAYSILLSFILWYSHTFHSTLLLDLQLLYHSGHDDDATTPKHKMPASLPPFENFSSCLGEVLTTCITYNNRGIDHTTTLAAQRRVQKQAATPPPNGKRKDRDEAGSSSSNNSGAQRSGTTSMFKMRVIDGDGGASSPASSRHQYMKSANVIINDIASFMNIPLSK